MERVTFRRPDVREFLSGVVCLKVDLSDRRPNALADKFRVKGLPTLVLAEPDGRKLYHDSGAPAPDQFAEFFSYKPYNAAIKASNAKQWAAAAPHVFLLRKWFSRTPLVKKAGDWLRSLDQQPAFKAAYEAAQKNYTDRMRKLREELRKKEERRAACRKLKAEADTLYKKYRRFKAYKIYKQLILQFPKSPEAEDARRILKKHKQPFKEPR